MAAKEIGNDLENWMTNLPIKLRKLSIISLAIPGTHDSMTFDITRNSGVAPDAPGIVKRCACAKGPASRYAKTQDWNVTQQLKGGIRYFDLRIATRNKTDKFYFTHSLYAGEAEAKFKEIDAFLINHPKEVVILDCNHFYGFDDAYHFKLLSLINKTFSTKLLPYTNGIDMKKLSLEYLTEENAYQVIVVYYSELGQKNTPKLWPADSFPSPWPNTDNINSIFNKLDSYLAQKSPEKAFISQCILTPSNNFVFKHLSSSLKKEIAIPMHRKQFDWLNKQKPGPKGVNIIINDFVNLENPLFSQVVIGLNNKLLN